MNLVKTTIKIRRATVSDAAAIATLIYKSFVEYRSLYTERAFDATTPGLPEIAERIRTKSVWLALENNSIIGTVSVFTRNDGLFVRSLAVGPAARGKGVGRTLMEHVHEMAFATGSSSIILNTTPFLLPAIKLYESFGFEAQGRADLFGTTLIKMRKSLAPVRRSPSDRN